MVEVVPGGTHAITCTRLALLDGSRIFVRTKWFNTSFSVTALAFPRSWSCHVAKQEVVEIASASGINCEKFFSEFFSQARLHLGDGMSDSQYSFEAVGRRPNTMRLSWTTTDARYNDEPRMALYFQEDNSTMELVPEFLNVLMDTTLIVKDLLARRKINKSKKVRQLAMRFSASERVRKRSLCQQAPTREGMRGGLDGLVVKSEFPNSGTPKFNSSTVSYEPASGLSTPTHPPCLTAHLDGRAQQHELRSPATGSLKPSPRQMLQSVSSTSKSLNPLGVYNAGRLVSEDETVPCYGHQAEAFCFDRPNGLANNYGGVSLGQLKSFASGYHGLSENCKREPAQAQAQADVQRMRALDHRGEAVQVPMTDDHDYIMDRVGSSQLKLPVKVDVCDELERIPPPKLAARVYDHGLSSWPAPPRTPVRTTATTVDIGSMSRPSPTFHDVAGAKPVHKTPGPACDKGVLSHEARKLGLGTSTGGSGWINPRKSSIGVESRSFELAGSTRRSASQGREGIIMLSDSDSDEDYHNIEVDPGVLDHPEDLLDPRIPAAMGGLSDEPDSRFSIMTGRSKDSMMPFPWRGNVELLNMNVSQVKDERSRSRLESDAPASLGWQSRSRKRKDRDDVHEEHRTDILFGEGKRTHTYGFVPEEQVLPSRASLSWSRGALDAQAFVPAPSGTPACVKLEDAYQSEQNAVWLSGDHRHEKHASTFNYGSRAPWKPIYHTADHRPEKFTNTFNCDNRAQWNTWISEAKTEVTAWEAQIQNGNCTTGGSGRGGDQPTEKVVNATSPCGSKFLDGPLSLKKLDRNLDVVDFPPSDCEQLQSPRETPNALRPQSEAKSARERLENIARDLSENRCTREMGKSQKLVGVSSDVPQLEKVKVERVVEVENDGDSDSVEEHVFEPGLSNDNIEGMAGAGESVAEVLKSRLRESAASRRPLEKGVHGRKLTGRRGRPPGVKVQSHPNLMKSVSQGATDGMTQSDKDPRKNGSQRTARPVGRPKHSSSTCSEDEQHTVMYEVKKSLVDVDQELQKTVPDSDYYCFDGDRGREKIKPNQIWALYDDMDTMPRTLIRVKEVSMNGAFWVKASWLQPHTKKHDRQKKAGGTLFPRSCGEFEEPRETTIIRVLNCFSHRMECTAKGDTVMQVYPRKGEVWALHKKDDGKQKDKDKDKDKEKKGGTEKNNSNNGGSSFRLVVILANCEEGRAAEILVLRKRTGYRTLWEPGYKKGSLPMGNMELFSHRVPAYKLKEKDYPDLNKEDIWDIDAAAVPTCQSKVT